MSRDLHIFRTRDSDQRLPRGFTLTEILVAVAITGFVSLAIYGTFASTSEAMREADSLVDAVNRARFAVEQLRSDFQNAGSFASPDSKNDPWVQPKRNVRVTGLAAYSGWQDKDLGSFSGLDRTANKRSDQLEPHFDGIILIGAYDFPGTFEITDLNSSADEVEIERTRRGLFKLAQNDPFATNISTTFETRDFQAIKRPYPNSSSPVDNALTNSVLRVQDQDGYFQFAAITGFSKVSGGSGTEAIKLTLDSGLTRKPKGADPVDSYGLPPQSTQTGDRTYQAAMLDVFWYHVVQDPQNDRNLMLVRERLNGKKIINKLENKSLGSISPSSHRAYGANDYTVVAERVVDFQIWVDCTTNSDGSVQTGWSTAWSVSASTSPHDCLTNNPGRARMVHARLSVRAATERTDKGHLNGDGFTTGDNPRMRTFDLRPDSEGAASVYTTQTDIELTNFAMRNISPSTSTSTSSP